MSADDKSATAVGGSALSDGLGPLPPPRAIGYTADDMRAHGRQERDFERERCAKMCEVVAVEAGDRKEYTAQVFLGHAAWRIRGRACTKCGKPVHIGVNVGDQFAGQQAVCTSCGHVERA